MLDAVLNWIAINQSWAYIIVAVIAFGESLAIVGLIVPGAFLLFGIGGLIGLGQLEVWPTLISAMIGAILGDGISFWLGYHYREHLAQIWPFTRYPALIEKGKVFFKRHGGKSIIFGRFVGPIRPIVPAIAGMMRMSVPKYISINILSAVAWSPAYIMPTALLVGYTKEQASEVTQNLIVFILGFVILIWLVFTLLRKLTSLKIAFGLVVIIPLIVVTLLVNKNDHNSINATLETDQFSDQVLSSYGWRHIETINHRSFLKLFDPNTQSVELPVFANECAENNQLWSHGTAVNEYLIILCINSQTLQSKITGYQVYSVSSIVSLPLQSNDSDLLKEQLNEVFLANGQHFEWQRENLIIGN